jgi:predicted O-linked N-acetylglucosamine transferase (SPINDLY family)
MTIPSSDLRQTALQLCAQSRFEEARVLLIELLKQRPGDAEAWVLLAKLYYQQRDHVRALAAVGNATHLVPAHAEALYLLGRLHRDQGALNEAEACYRRALASSPDHPDILTSLGVLLRARGQTNDAILMYRRALEVNPAHREAENNLGNALAAVGLTAEARPRHEHARTVLAARVGTMRTAAEELMAQGKLKDAHALLLDALQIVPHDAALWLTAGRLDCALGRPQLGLDNVERAVRLDPESIEANEVARRICTAAGLYDRAVHYAERMLALSPTEEIVVARRLQLPSIQQSRQTIRETRDRYARGLVDSFACAAPLKLPPSYVGKSPFVVAAHTAFYLAYHGENNRDLQMELARLYLKRMPGLSVTAEHCLGGPRRPGRLRVGFISRFLRKHSIGTTTRGLIDRLSREVFEVYAIRITPSADDATTQAIRASADITVDLDPELSIARAQLAALALDILFFQDIGMEPTSYFLAFARLAPVQCVSFGHPDTTGIPNVDYFVSNDLFEPENAQAHYSERLFLLRDLPTLAYYYRPRVPQIPVPREKFGFSTSETLYVCPQALFKLHPDFDALLHGILIRNPKGVVVLIDGLFKEPSEQLRSRFARTLPATAHRVKFVPRLAYPEFLELLSVADVILDTVHFNGMNTSLEAFASGTPVVTLPTEFQRGRHTQAMYRKMEILDCIASSDADYIDIAVRLATDRSWANSIRGRLREKSRVLFEDRRVVEEFERFFLESVRWAARGDGGAAVPER